MKFKRLGTLLASLALLAASCIPSVSMASAAAAPLGLPTPPVLTPPAPTSQDKVQKGTQGGVKGVPAVTTGGFSINTVCPGSPAKCYSYAGARRNAGATPFVAASIGMRVAQPALDTADYHTLAEMSVHGGNNIIEVGWNVDRVVNGGTTTPHLFVSAWYDNAGTSTWCGVYNGGCGYTDYAANTLNAGADISADLNTTTPQVMVQYSAGNWWIYYKNNWIGYFPAALGHSIAGFTNASTVQTFGEIAHTRTPTCTDMGNGNFASATGTYPGFGADFYNLNTMNTTTWAGANYTGTVVTDATKWNEVTVGGNSARYGGPGATPSPTACP